jgi:hypothetical protein
MTDLLDRPVAAEHEADLPPDHDAAPFSPRRRAGADKWFLAALLVGAGSIHIAIAPSHLGESALEGAGFLVAAWVQLALAVAVLLRTPSRRFLAAVTGTSVALIAA